METLIWIFSISLFSVVIVLGLLKERNMYLLEEIAKLDNGEEKDKLIEQRDKVESALIIIVSIWLVISFISIAVIKHLY